MSPFRGQNPPRNCVRETRPAVSAAGSPAYSRAERHHRTPIPRGPAPRQGCQRDSPKKARERGESHPRPPKTIVNPRFRVTAAHPSPGQRPGVAKAPEPRVLKERRVRTTGGRGPHPPRWGPPSERTGSRPTLPQGVAVGWVAKQGLGQAAADLANRGIMTPVAWVMAAPRAIPPHQRVKPRPDRSHAGSLLAQWRRLCPKGAAHPRPTRCPGVDITLKRAGSLPPQAYLALRRQTSPSADRLRLSRAGPPAQLNPARLPLGRSGPPPGLPAPLPGAAVARERPTAYTPPAGPDLPLGGAALFGGFGAPSHSPAHGQGGQAQTRRAGEEGSTSPAPRAGKPAGGVAARAADGAPPRPHLP